MIKFYLLENGTYTEKEILVGANDSQTFDETLDSSQIALKSNTDDTPIKPDTKCYILFPDNTKSLFIVANDSVDIFARDGNFIYYRHNLQLVQNTRLLQKHLVRNTSFSQPRDSLKRGRTYDFTNEFVKIKLANKEKILPNSLTVRLTLNQTLQSQVADNNITTIYNNFYVLDGSSTVIQASDPAKFVITVKYIDSSTETLTYNGSMADITFDTDIHIPFEPTNIATIDEISISLYTTINGTDYAPKVIRNATNQLSRFTNTIMFFNIGIYNYTMYDIVETLLKQYKQADNYYTDGLRPTLFSMPQSTTDLYTVLKNTIAPNLTFTNATMYECLAEIFKYYDAIFTLDENNELGIEYLNEFNKEKVLTTFSNKIVNISEENYSNRYVSYFEDAITKETFMTVCRNTTLGFNKDNDTDWAFIFPHEIHSIIKAEIYISSGMFRVNEEDSINSKYYNRKYVDMTDFFTSESLYALLTNFVDPDTPSAYCSYNTQNKANTFYYNGNQITIGKMLERFSTAPYKHITSFLINAIFNYFFSPLYSIAGNAATFYPNDHYENMKIRLTYNARVNGRVLIDNGESKYDGETLVNQGNGGVDLGKLGLNMLGLSYKLGQPTLSMSQSFTDFSNRIKKGQIYEYNNEKWVANVVKYTFYNNKMSVDVDFIKNYNALSQRIQVDRQKRLSQISNELTVLSEDNYCEYAYLSSTTMVPNYQSIAITSSVFDNLMKATFGIEAVSKALSFGTIDTYLGTATSIKSYLFIPTIKYASANALCFEMAYDHPTSAGNQTQFSGDDAGNTTWLDYTSNGWADSITFRLCDYSTADFGHDFPQLTSSMVQELGKITKLEYFKKPNEILALNYEIIFLPLPERANLDFIGNAFLKESAFITNDKHTKSFRFFYSKTDIYSLFDLKGETENTTEATISSIVFLPTFIKILLPQVSDPQTIKSWSICNQQGDIMFASNTPLTDDGTNTIAKIFYITRHNRL